MGVLSSNKPNQSPAAEAPSAVIFSLSGTKLTEGERALFQRCNPLGFILFARNCDNPDQLRALTDDLKETVGRNCPVLIDQEGGRVQRLKPPRWREHPPMKHFGDLAAADMDSALGDLRFTILQIAEELQDAGINVNCAPVLDLLYDGAHECIGDRAFSSNIGIVSRLGVSVCRNLLRGGITPVIKHLPGHGRAGADSHYALPVVDTDLVELEATDFVPFKRIAESDVGPAAWGMMAHVVYTAIDPKNPSSISPAIINDIVRGQMGFDGLLVSDDLDMKALDAYGDVTARCVKTLEAGCDVALYCSGRLPDMEKIAESVPKLSKKAVQRLQKSAEFTKLAA